VCRKLPVDNHRWMAGWRKAEKVRDLGFSGKGSIHPKQIAAINAVFTPTEE